MSNIKPSLAKGTRDFSPQEMVKRNFIFDTVKTVFKKYGYAEIQTPSMENLSTLTGKYGDEGDKLIFKILNSGDYLAKVKPDLLTNANSNAILPSISEKALRYDLTVPFARYVVMHQNDISLPFKRFQVQPVWRADRPQKGRYREFYQCDVDVVGSDSLLNEAEFILIYQEALTGLGLKNFTIKINNRKILSGIAEVVGKPELIIDMTVAIDKLDKIGLDGVVKELLERGFTDADIERLKPVILLQGSNTEKLESLKKVLSASAAGLKGIEEIETVFDYVNSMLKAEPAIKPDVELDITLARGLNYYTGCIFEVKTNEVAMGSIGGGGRYDDLTGMFGLKGLTGVGVSFGADRIYDVLQELNLFPESTVAGTKVLISNFDKEAEEYALPVLQQLRSANIAAELYPSSAKLKKQMSYADDKHIPYVMLIGSDEMESGMLTLKDMQSGQQQKLTAESIVELLKKD
ncbi:histidine--tRNA ligase [Pedobacter heparinus]|uniref:Histidine--tRNA ligase n=1 Tax=Pedobacter heparinus (strain ATCC 13125 / DSM 2366 / CIP 104194 / JCM 7457 / NBRC 12017 / NCIMB 9290 / NRRL B-14731 / HIM 762-3) TaxID=485917 RepID=C6XYD2_PEDHD|nr:histidine--tRNA ligase [Pedobacter heparinus]ACU02399.1 histidyl-tRNA synthetase [Pedobacter heparinus DSM 2366]